MKSYNLPKQFFPCNLRSINNEPSKQYIIQCENCCYYCYNIAIISVIIGCIFLLFIYFFFFVKKRKFILFLSMMEVLFFHIAFLSSFLQKIHKQNHLRQKKIISMKSFPYIFNHVVVIEWGLVYKFEFHSKILYTSNFDQFFHSHIVSTTIDHIRFISI